MKAAPLIRFRIDFAEHANLGPGKVALLEGIRAHGSLSEAARQMGMTYRRAWLLIDSLNKSFNLPATVHSVGGRDGGGTEVTAFGILLIECYREVEEKLNGWAGRHLEQIGTRVNRAPPPSARRVPVSKRRRKGA